MRDYVFKRGDIVYVNYADGVGSEQGGVRPSVVVSNDRGNEAGPTLVVIPMTTKSRVNFPTHHVVKKGNGLAADSIALCEQIRVINKTRVIRHAGRLPEATMKSLEKKIKVTLAL